MKVAAALAIALTLSSAAPAFAKAPAGGQDDDRVKRIVERIEKEIRDSHEKTREEIRAIIRAEIQKTQPGATPAPAARSTKVYLGISADDLTEADRKALGSGSGVKVAGVRGPAKDAGIQPGDLLIELDGQPVTEERLGEILAAHRPGDSIPATVLRAKKRVELKIVLAERRD
ncbi:MAG TPA: PDZ domain-containing protein [Planctomycetota bacterium]|nr:PDZ domain-containing protein [Planctomycetota bacterium]